MSAPAATGEAAQRLERRITAVDSLLCVGLDPERERLPARLQEEPDGLFLFCREVIDRTAEFTCAFKPNTAFFEAEGARGWNQLQRVFDHLRTAHPEVWTICDAKRGDIGSTNRGYVRAIFDGLGADAVTLQPYLGAEALAPFLEREDKVSIVLCRTSNTGAGELQDATVGDRPLWEHVAKAVSTRWNDRGNCMLVVGATWPAEMARIRAVAPAMTFLVPGIGAQGGDVEAVMAAGLRGDGRGLVLSSSRAILYADNPAEAARATRDAMRAAAKKAAAASGRERGHAGR